MTALHGNVHTIEKRDHRVPLYWFPIFLVFFGGLFYATYANFKWLPTPNLSDDLSLPEFNAAVARNHLTNLTKDGPKVAGGLLNEGFAVEYLQGAVEKIKQTMHPNHKIDVEVQKVDGMLPLSINTHYRGLQNVVVRLRNAAVDSPTTALLINSHYDTVAVSPGGGDATSMVAVMLETLRVLATKPDTTKHAIIFLFNGAEELGLMGSHAWVMQHKWAHTAKVLINLDACGNGGREILFQASPGHSWLMNYYRKHAPHPYSSSLAEELFQGGVIPSDTDFRIFRDFGKIPGLDFAYNENGYVYHTKHDTADIVPDGTLQNTGDNLLAMASALADADELYDPESHMDDDAVFFDFLNIFMIYYTKYEAIIINSVVIVACIFLQIVSYFVDRALKKGETRWSWRVPVYFVVQIVSLVIGCAAGLALAYLYPSMDKEMAWFSSNYLIFFQYMCPLFFCMTFLPAIFQMVYTKNISPWASVEHSLNLHSWLLMILLTVMTAMGVRSAFMIMIPLCFHVIFLMILIILKFLRLGGKWRLVCLYIVQLIPFVFYANWTIIAFANFIPISGRNGTSSDSELIILVFAIGMALLMAGFLTPTVNMFKQSVIASLCFAVMWAVIMGVIHSSVGFPYKAETAPQRMNVYHVDRSFYDIAGDLRRDDSVIIASGLDPNWHFGLSYMGKDNILNGFDECQNEWICGLPALNSVNGNTYLYEADKPTIPSTDTNITLIEKSFVDGVIEFTFEASCPNNCAIYLASGTGAFITYWSMEGSYTNTKNLYRSQLFNLNVEAEDTFKFNVILNVPRNYSDDVLVLRVGILGQYTAHRKREDYSDDFLDFLAKFPAWTTTNDWIQSFKSYEF